ncbi:MAG: type IX secretion system outer membrane channel protein PorV [Saprospiraceae bacterium]|nr:type IX secretion system outer membrane channel protein PorV [Saprospiraceae bacterium]
MRRTPISTLAISFILLLSGFEMQAQCIETSPGTGIWVLPDGSTCPNAIPTAVPFLRITPDARTGAMGDAGIAISPDANSMHINTSKLAFTENDFAISATYSPWLRSLGLQDVYLAYLAGYRRLDDLQSIGFSLRYFSLGDIQFTNENGEPAGFGRPNEFEVAVGFARKLGENFSVGINGKLIYSNLAGGQEVNGIEINPGVAGAADISFYYAVPLDASKLSFGLNLSNLGSKITYTKETNDFLPANFGLGAAWEVDFDEYNKLTLAADLNKLMVPTPEHSSDPGYNDEGDPNIPDYRERSFFRGVLGSFGDAPGGASEELKEFTYSVGAEYWYDGQFAIRAGYFHENRLKGNRRYFTTGLGLKYNVFGINMSYLISTNSTTQQSNPLDKTLRFSLLFDFGELGSGDAADPSL